MMALLGGANPGILTAIIIIATQSCGGATACSSRRSSPWLGDPRGRKFEPMVACLEVQRQTWRDA
jgi:hypothetical protein